MNQHHHNCSLFFLLLASCLFFPFLICYAYPDGWSDDVLVSPDSVGVRGHPDISVDGENNVWVIWDSLYWGNGYVYYSKRDSLGGCLIPETMVSTSGHSFGGCKIKVDQSNCSHVVWREQSPQGFGLGYAKLADNGSVIVPAHLVLNGAGAMFTSTLVPDIALTKYNEVNIIWDEAPSGYNQMDYTKLDSLGNPIISKIQITPVNIYAYWPGIGVDSFANSHLGYRSDSSTTERLVYTKVDKDGNIVVNNKVLTTGAGPTFVSDRNQKIHVVYGHPTGTGYSIEYLKLDNNGNILIGPKTISLPQINVNLYVHMAMDSMQYLHVVWQADSNTDVHVMYAKLDTNGNVIIPPMKIVYPYQAIMPRIAVDGSNRLHVVWVDGRLNPAGDIFYKRGENEMTVKEIAQLKAVNLPKLSVFPNPFSRETRIVFSFSRENEKTQIKIYDILGRKVKEFMVEGSDGVIQWQGTDNNGNHLPAGVYFLRMTSTNMKQTVPVVLLR